MTPKENYAARHRRDARRPSRGERNGWGYGRCATLSIALCKVQVRRDRFFLTPSNARCTSHNVRRDSCSAPGRSMGLRCRFPNRIRSAGRLRAGRGGCTNHINPRTFSKELSTQSSCCPKTKGLLLRCETIPNLPTRCSNLITSYNNF